MPTKPTELNKAQDIAAFHLHFLADGFRQADRKLFFSHCTKLTRQLLAISQFSLAKKQLSVTASFTVSQQQGIGAGAPRDTAFEFFTAPGDRLHTRNPAAIITAVKDLDPVPGGGAENVAPALTGSDVWLYEGTRWTRAVCVIAFSPDRLVTTVRGYGEPDLDDPAFDDAELDALLPFIAVTMWPTRPTSVPQYTNPFQAAAFVLAREIASITGLEYENEQTDAGHEQFDPTLLDPDADNLLSDRALRDGGSPSVDRIPWSPLMGGFRRTEGIVEHNHPVLTVVGETPEQEKARYEPIRADMARKIVILKHPISPGNPGDTSGVANTRYDTPGRKLVKTDEPNLIEGGGGFRRGIYRASAECAMRIEADDAVTGAARKREMVPFCRVCSASLKRDLAGVPAFRFGGLHVLRGQESCTKGKVASALADRLVQYIHAKTDAAIGGMLCVEATTWRYEHFFNEVLDWPHILQLAITTDWYTTPVPWPKIGARGRDIWTLWMTAYTKLRTTPRLWKYSGLGAAGAIVFARLGCLANRVPKPSEETDVDGKKVKLRFVSDLTVADLDNLTAGSVLQMWKSEALYKSIVRYVHRITNDVPPVTPNDGHSLFYMGKENNVHIIADQNGTRVPFDKNYPEGDRLPFWIGAQWHDAVNVPAQEPGSP